MQELKSRLKEIEKHINDSKKDLKKKASALFNAQEDLRASMAQVGEFVCLACAFMCVLVRARVCVRADVAFLLTLFCAPPFPPPTKCRSLGSQAQDLPGGLVVLGPPLQLFSGVQELDF